MFVFVFSAGVGLLTLASWRTLGSTNSVKPKLEESYDLRLPINSGGFTAYKTLMRRLLHDCIRELHRSFQAAGFSECGVYIKVFSEAIFVHGKERRGVSHYLKLRRFCRLQLRPSGLSTIAAHTHRERLTLRTSQTQPQLPDNLTACTATFDLLNGSKTTSSQPGL